MAIWHKKTWQWYILCQTVGGKKCKIHTGIVHFLHASCSHLDDHAHARVDACYERAEGVSTNLDDHAHARVDACYERAEGVSTNLDDHAHARVDACYERAEGWRRIRLHRRTVEANLQQRLVLTDVKHLQRSNGINRDMTHGGLHRHRVHTQLNSTFRAIISIKKCCFKYFF